MNNVISMFKNNTAMSDIRSKGYGSADFDIETKPLDYTCWINNGGGTDTRRCSKSITYRTDTGQELGIHGAKYQAVPPKQMIDVTRNIIERSDLNTTGLQETIRTSHDGSRTFVQYKLPDHTYSTPDGDSASLSLLAISSFDGTWPFMISAAAIQQACTNLQVFVSGEVAVYKAKHTKNLDIELGGRVITKSLDAFENERDLWSQWSTTHCTDEMAMRLFAKAVKSKQIEDDLQQGYSAWDCLDNLKRSNKNLNYIWNQYKNIYTKRLGKNYWSAYNALTDWSTHANTFRNSTEMNIASVSNDRQEAVKNAVQNNRLMRVA
jgi:hypothetical protein